MKKLAVLLGLSGALLSARADMTRTFDWTFEDDCGGDLGACLAFEYPEGSTTFEPASGGFGSGNVLRNTLAVSGAYSSSGVGVVFGSWDPLDASALTAIKVSLRSNTQTSLRISLKNSEDEVYDAMGLDGLGYMTDVEVTPEGNTVTIPVKNFLMPTWWPSNAAADTWVGSTKATDKAKSTDTAALNAGRRRVLSSITAIQVAANCDATKSCALDGWFEIEDMVLVGVKDADGANWWDVEPASVLPRKAIQGLRTAIDGQFLTIGRTEASAASLDLVRLDGSKVASWDITGSVASVALPNGLEKGTYYAVVNSAGKRQSTAVSIVR